MFLNVPLIQRTMYPRFANPQREICFRKAAGLIKYMYFEANLIRCLRPTRNLSLQPLAIHSKILQISERIQNSKTSTVEKQGKI